MTKAKKKTLPKNFDDLITVGDLAALKAVFDECALNAYARGSYDKETALHHWDAPLELIRWLVAQGLDVNTATSTHKKTPLHKAAQIRISGGRERVALLLELGADVNATDHSGDTPLHFAERNPDAVQALLAHGANPDMENRSGQTPLAYALARCANAEIENVAKVAELLLGAGAAAPAKPFWKKLWPSSSPAPDTGAKITPEMRESVKRIGEQFEFDRADFNPEYLEATDAALTRLYQLFNVPPVPRRAMHDGKSPITVKTATWQKQHGELWDLLVPSSGAAATVQGEVIRITGRVNDEILRNGGGNWDADYRKMLNALLRHLASGTPLSAADLTAAKTLAASVTEGDGSETGALCELAVRWVLQNPQPAPLDTPDYRR
jgi:hypothetical protein